jgi:hypothetical protein
MAAPTIASQSGRRAVAVIAIAAVFAHMSGAASVWAQEPAAADYEVTGVMTFIVSHDGVVYQKNLGPETLDEFRAMELYNPDSSWDPVAEE